jgi:hypothetical protein
MTYIHPQITFEVIAHTPQKIVSLYPLPDAIEHIVSNLEKSDVYLGNKAYRHGDRFTLEGMAAIRYKNLFVDVADPILKIIASS